MTTKHKYEEGGRVQISGKWYEIENQGGLHYKSIRFETTEGVWLQPVSDFCGVIQAYSEPPKKEVVHEWLDDEQMSGAVGDKFGQYSIEQRNSLNKKLTNLYGAPPIVRTYNGEKAEEFGLEYHDYVLYWGGDCWDGVAFEALDDDDKWMLQPPAHKD